MTTAYTQVSKTRERSQRVIHTLKIKFISALRWPSAADTVKKDTVLMSPDAAVSSFCWTKTNSISPPLSLAFFLSSRSHFSLLSFPPLPFLPCWSSCKCSSGGVIVGTHSDTMGQIDWGEAAFSLLSFSLAQVERHTAKYKGDSTFAQKSTNLIYIQVASKVFGNLSPTILCIYRPTVSVQILLGPLNMK